MHLLEGKDHAEVCRLHRQVSEGTMANEPEEEVGESRMKQQKNIRCRREYAVALPKMRKKIRLCFKCHL